jgi:hypothetical protein
VNIDESDVRALLRRTVAGVTSPPDFVEGVRRTGRRQLARRRLLTGAGLACVAAVTAGGAVRARRGEGEPIDPATRYFDRPTRGDLAADRSYLDSVRRAWSARTRDLEPGVRGQPHVVWAGTTPAGPAAYVIQRAAEYPADPGERVFAVMAFVRPGGQGPEVMSPHVLAEGPRHWSEQPQAVLLGAGWDVLLVLDPGHPVELSTDFRYTADGKVERAFQPVRFDDGAAVVRVPPQAAKVTVALRDDVGVPIAIGDTAEIVVRGGLPPEHTHTLPGAERAWRGDPLSIVFQFVEATHALAEYDDPGGTHAYGDTPRLTLYGVTPDGRRLYVTTLQFDDDPTRVIALLARGDTPFRPVASGFVDWTEPLPVRLRLPDGQGTLVAAEGSALSYRAGGGWRDAGRHAALVPAGASQVRVTPSSGAASTVDLR